MIGCLVVGLLIIILFVVAPAIWWPFLLIALVLLFAFALVTGILRAILGALGGLFGRR